MRIVAFGHQKEVGKSTAAGFLNTLLRIAAPKLVIKHAPFADKLKDVAYQLYSWAGLERAIYYETHYLEKEMPLPLLDGRTPRDIWIGVGNKMRDVWQPTWIDYVLKNIKADIIIISDLRFENEANAIRAARGILIKIARGGIPRGADPAEISLLHWIDWDKVIINNGTLNQLNEQMEALAKEILE